MSSSPLTFSNIRPLSGDPTPTTPPASSGSDGLTFSNVRPIGGTDAPTGDSSTPAPNRGTAENLAGGWAEGAAKTDTGILNVAGHALEHVLGKPAGSLTGTFQDNREAPSVARDIGEGSENVAEFMAGDSLIGRAAKLVDAAKTLPGIGDLVKLAEKHKWAANILEEGIKGGVVGGVQGGVKGAAEGKGVEGAEGGAVGGTLGGTLGAAAGEGLEAISNSDLSKAMMNRSTGATKNMVRYANPADALASEDLPVFSTLTNKGREEAAQAKLNQLKPQLDSVLQQSPAIVDWRQILAGPIQEARAEVGDALTLTDEAKNTMYNQIDAFEKNILARHPSGQVNMLEANELKRRIGSEGAEFDAKPDASDTIRNLYTHAYGALKDVINSEVPAVKDLNQRVSNLTALKKATHETILAEKAGIGPLSGFGVARKAEAAVGHVAPAVARTTKSVKPALATASAAAGTGLGRILFTDSQGGTHSIPDDVQALAHAKTIDPGLKVIQ